MPDDPQDASEGDADDAGDHEGVPADLIALHEAAEYQRTVAGGEGHPR